MFAVLPEGVAGEALTDSLVETNRVFVLEMFTLAASVVALGEQVGGKRMIPLRTATPQLEH